MMWIVAPSHVLADWVRSASVRAAIAGSRPAAVDTEMLSAAALCGRVTSRVVLGQRASIIIRPSTKTWLLPAPRSHDWPTLEIELDRTDQPPTTSAPLTVTRSLL